MISNHPRYANITTFTQSIVSSISDAQNDFFIANGRYFQGLWLLGNSGHDGMTDIDTVNTSHPGDFGFSWRDFAPQTFKNNLKIPINIKIDVYESPSGWGWILRAEVFYPGLGPDNYGNDGDHWFYQHHEGPALLNGIWDEWFIKTENPGE